MDRTILHCDLNNFFVSASCIGRPELSHVPVTVCGDASQRHGIVLAKNQLAKRAGVKTGQPIWQAAQLCPGMVTLRPDYPLYMQISKTVRAIYDRYTGQIEPFGIDECWLDITSFHPHASFAERTANEIRETVKKETGLTVSVGVSWNKIFAKMGSDYKKPDAVTVIDRGNYRRIVWPLPAGDLLCIGRATRARLEKAGILTIGDVACAPAMLLKALLGQNGLMLHTFATGMDDSPVKAVDHEMTVKGIGNSMTTVRDLKTEAEVREAFLILSDMVASRARKKGLQGKTIAIWLRDSKLEWITRQTVLPRPTYISDEIAQCAMKLYRANWDACARPIRAIGVRITALTPIEKHTQLSFFDAHRQRMQSLEFAKDDIMRRFGPEALTRASLLCPQVIERHAKELHEVHPISYFQK